MIRTNSFNRIILLLVLVVLNLNALCQANQQVAGNYEGAVLIGYDSIKKEISGIISMEQNDYDNKTVKFSCMLWFSGKTGKSKEIVINYYSPLDSAKQGSGSMLIRDKAITLKTTNSVITFCQNIIDLAGNEGATFSQSFQTRYQAVGMIKQKSFLYNTPSDSGVTKSYLIKNDVVGILKRNGEWCFIEYGGAKVVRKWIRSIVLWPAS